MSSEARATAFECTTCRNSVRFRPLYRFTTGGPRPEVMLKAPAAIQCGACGQAFQWEKQGPPDSDAPGGWTKLSLLEDAEHSVTGN